MSSFNTLADMLDVQSDRPAHIGFIDGAHDERGLNYTALARAALHLLAILQDRGARPGDPLVLFIADNLHFVELFWAAIYGGLVPLPIAAGGSPAHLDKLVTAWRHLGQPRIIADTRHTERLRDHLEQSGARDCGERLAACIVSDEPPGVETAAVRAEVQADDTALIQFSSGSTGDPKGVVLSHASIRAIGEGSRFGNREVALSWMPLTQTWD